MKTLKNFALNYDFFSQLGANICAAVEQNPVKSAAEKFIGFGTTVFEERLRNFDTKSDNKIAAAH